MQRSSARISRKLTRQEETVACMLPFEGADFSRGQTRVRLFRKPALRQRLRRLISLVVIVVMAIGLWLAVIWAAFALLAAGT